MERHGEEIFISYRRDDTRLIVERMHEHLMKTFGAKSVFIDIENIPAGKHFPDHIEEILNSCKVVLVIIGKDWSSLKDADGQVRLHNSGDFVRAEVEWAGRSNKTVIPILFDGATMPSADSIPESIRFITQLHALEVRPGAYFAFTIDRLVSHLSTAHGLKRKDRPFRWELAMLVAGIFASVVGTMASPILISLTFGSSCWYASDAFHSLIPWEFFGPFLLGAGPLAIALSRWMCCHRSAQLRPAFANGIFPADRKSPNSMIAFAFGLSSIGWGILSVPFTFLFAYRGWNEIRKSPQMFRGKNFVIMAIIAMCTGVAASSAMQVSAWNTYRLFCVMDLAQSRLMNGELAEARLAVDEVVNAIPEHTRPYYLAGQLYLAEAEYEDAITAFSYVIEDLEKSLSRVRRREILLDAYRKTVIACDKLGFSEMSKDSLRKITELELQLERETTSRGRLRL